MQQLLLKKIYVMAESGFDTIYSQIMGYTHHAKMSRKELTQLQQNFYQSVTDLTDNTQPYFLTLINIESAIGQVFYQQYITAYAQSKKQGTQRFNDEQFKLLYKCGYAQAILETLDDEVQNEENSTAYYTNCAICKEYIDDVCLPMRQIYRHTLLDIVKFGYHDAQLGLLGASSRNKAIFALN